jgi:hypothetical protein
VTNFLRILVLVGDVKVTSHFYKTSVFMYLLVCSLMYLGAEATQYIVFKPKSEQQKKLFGNNITFCARVDFFIFKCLAAIIQILNYVLSLICCAR